MKNIATMSILNFILLMSTTLFTNEVYGYFLPACTGSTYGRFPYPKSCTKYFECLNRQVTVFSCRPGLVYNPSLAECDLPENVRGCENVQAQVNTLVICPKDFIGQVPHPKDCKQFAQCFHGVTHFMICKPGSVYNIENGYCDIRENVPGCYGDMGNGINFRGDISISLQNLKSVGDPYQGYIRQAPCRTPGCLPVNRKTPEVGSLFPTGPVPPLKEHPVPFRKPEIEQPTKIPQFENVSTLSEANLDNASEKMKDELLNVDNSIGETENSNNEKRSLTTNAASYDVSRVTTNGEIEADNTNSEVEMTTEKSKSDDISTPNDFNAATKPQIEDDYFVELTMRTTKSPSNEVGSTSNNMTSEVTETAELPEDDLRVVGLSNPKDNKNVPDLRPNSRFFEFKPLETISGRSADSSEGWLKKSWSDPNTIESEDEIKEKEIKPDLSGDKQKDLNKSEVLRGKDSTTTVSPTKSDSHQSFYVTINGTKHHYIYKEVQIDQDHSKIRSYNQAPMVANAKKVSDNPTQIDTKSINLDHLNDKSTSSLETEPPFPLHYIPPIYFRSIKDIPKLTPLSGQSLRLRGGPDLNHGYVEVQGAKPGWGVVCHTAGNWTLTEADIICRQMGYRKGAQMAWKGRLNDDEIYPWVATSYVQCQGNETWFQTCKFRDNSECNIQRDAVGIRCLQDNKTYCREDEVFHEGFCYHLAELNFNLNHAEAEQRCKLRNSSLLYITKQKENDFLSEWLIRKHPSVESVLMGGMGFPAVNRSQWIWKDSQKTKFKFSKWWPGWDNEKILPPLVVSHPSCIIMKKEFPCDNPNPTVCQADYFFWDAEDCTTPKKESSYICKRSSDKKNV